jgi:ABC-type branched-subunit amino acid transport system ATPase component
MRSGEPPVADENGQNVENILEARGITKVFGGLVAVEEVSFEIPRGRFVSIIGIDAGGMKLL